tara:strand:+ start:4587 stop:5603 length:1017 start_codon:yes stop_codon:yes gene_type:complete
MERYINCNNIGKSSNCYRTWKNDSFQSISLVHSNTHPIDNNNNYISSRINPIKHWRKQLTINGGYISRGKTTIAELNRPGGANYINKSKLETNNYLNNKSKCVITYINKIENKKNNCDNNIRNRIRNRTSLNENYHDSTKSYLQSRVKLYEQSLQFNMNEKNLENNEFNSLYNKYIYSKSNTNDCLPNNPQYISSCLTDCSCVVKIIYKPINKVFAKEGAVSSQLYTLNRRVNLNNNNQSIVNINNRCGLNGENSCKILNNSYLTSKCNNEIKKYTFRQPSGGSGNHTVCFYTPSYDINGRLGSILQTTRGASTGKFIVKQEKKCNSNNLCENKIRRK